MKLKSMFLALLLACMTDSAFGQVLNGDFSNQGDFWDLFRADTRSALCGDNLDSDTWGSGDLFWRGGSDGWAASLHDGWTGIRGDFRNTCGSIRQTITVPFGVDLVYSLRLGTVNNLGPAPIEVPVHQQVIFTTTVETTSGVDIIDSRTGRSVNTPCFTSCPGWGTRRADISDYWGQTVDLEFFARSSYDFPILPGGLGARRPSPAYIDDIRFEEVQPNRFARPISGMWFNPDRSGHGVQVSRSPEGRFNLYWVTYLPDGEPIWFVAGSFLTIRPGQYEASLRKATRDPNSGDVTLQGVGSVEMRMLSNSEMILKWELTTASGSPSQGAEIMTHLHGGDSYTGLWFEPAFDGWGVTLDVEGSGTSTVSIATVLFYTPTGEPTWAQGVASGDLTQSVDFNMDTFTGIGLCPGCAGQAQSLQIFPAGTFNLQTMATQPAGFSAIQTAGGLSWIRGSAGAPVSLGRLTVP